MPAQTGAQPELGWVDAEYGDVQVISSNAIYERCFALKQCSIPQGHYWYTTAIAKKNIKINNRRDKNLRLHPPAIHIPYQHLHLTQSLRQGRSFNILVGGMRPTAFGQADAHCRVAAAEGGIGIRRANIQA